MRSGVWSAISSVTLKRIRERVDHFADEDFGSGGAGGDPDGPRLAEPAPIDLGCALDQPGGTPIRSATSASRSELLLLGAPITSIRSHSGAIAFTAAWRLEVA